MKPNNENLAASTLFASLKRLKLESVFRLIEQSQRPDSLKQVEYSTSVALSRSTASGRYSSELFLFSKNKKYLSTRREVFSRLQPLTLCKNIERIVQAVRSHSILRYLIRNRKNKCFDESLFSSDQRAIVCNCTPCV